MYQPSYIKINNFGSIKELEYNFKIGKSLIIQGKNLDDKGQKSNGVGKSSFNDAFGFTLTGISLRNLTNDELIRDGEKESYLELLLISKDKTKELLIKRSLFRKDAQKIEIWLNGEDKHKDLPSVNERNQFIIDTIGISKEDLFQFFIITKERYKPYFKLSDNDKKNVSGRFSKADSIDKIYPFLDNDISENLQLIQKTKTKISNIETKISTYEDEIENLNDKESKEKLKLDIQLEIENYNNQIIDLNSSIDNINKDIVEIQNQIIENENKIIKQSEIDVKNKLIEQLEENYNLLKKEFDLKINDNKLQLEKIKIEKTNTKNKILENEKDILEVKVLRSQIDLKLQSSINCPKCDHEFILNENESIDELKNELKELDNVIDDLENVLIKLQKDIIYLNNKEKSIDIIIDDLNNKFKKETEENRKNKLILSESINQIQKNNLIQKNAILNLESHNIDLNNKITNYQNRIRNYSELIDQKNNDLLNIDNIDNSETIKRYNQLIKDNQKELKITNSELLEQEKEQHRLNSWTLKFKSFKSYLANQSIKNIEDLTNYYLQNMNTDLTVEIDAYQKKKKDVKEKITETILRNGFPIGSYGRFSGGERARLDASLILCMQTLINNNAAPNGLDFIQIDEVMDSLDSQGIENIIKALQNSEKTLLLVTQNEINTLPEQTLTLVKRNNSTEIE